MPFLTCPSGWFGHSPPKDTCTACEPGTASSDGAVSCQACEPGKFSESKGSPKCSPCDQAANEFSETSKSTACETCDVDRISVGTKCTAIPFDASLKPPTNVYIQRLNAETFDQLNISWSITDPTDSITSFTMQLSPDPEFRKLKQIITITTESSSTHLVAPTFNNTDLRKTVQYVKIQSIGTTPTSFSAWSAATVKWRNINDNDCFLESKYLNTTSLDPTRWDCNECPRGGSCSGSLTFQEVDAMFGWSQCPTPLKATTSTKKFARCIFAPACLGGTNNALLKKYKLDMNSQVDPAKCEHNNCSALCSHGYANGSRLCGRCDFNFSHDGLSGMCKKCPSFGQNIGIAVGGVVGGIVGLVVLIQLTLSDGGTLDESDGAKSIGLSFIQLISLLVSFPIAWPPIFTAIFQVGGAITVLGQHLVNLKCLVPDYTDADVFYGVGLAWGVGPPLLLFLCVLTWYTVYALVPCFTVSELTMKIKTSCVTLLYLLWPSLCTQTFSLFACRSVCEENTSFLRADLEEQCWRDRHLAYALALGVPMLFCYVIGLPLLAYLRVRAMNQKLEDRRRNGAQALDLDVNGIVVPSLDDDSTCDTSSASADEGLEVFTLEHKIYGMFYSAFRKETWWWESTVAARKIVIAMIGVFGAEMKNMQVHFTIMLVVLIILITAQVRPFGGKKHGMLHRLEMLSLMATFLTLWAGSVFNTLPRCEDPDIGDGVTTLFWCDLMSVIVGVVDMLVVVAVVVCFVYLKATATKSDKDEDEEEDANGEKEEKNKAIESATTVEQKQATTQATKKKKKKKKEVNNKEMAVSMVENPLELRGASEKGDTVSVEIEMSNVGGGGNGGSGDGGGEGGRKEATPLAKIPKGSKTKKKRRKKTKKEDQHARNSTELPEGWQTLKTDEGQKYYVNRQTQQSSWTPPPGSKGGSSQRK